MTALGQGPPFGLFTASPGEPQEALHVEPRLPILCEMGWNKIHACSPITLTKTAHVGAGSGG